MYNVLPFGSIWYQLGWYSLISEANVIHKTCDLVSLIRLILYWTTYFQNPICFYIRYVYLISISYNSIISWSLYISLCVCYSREVTGIYTVLKKRLAYPLLKHRSCNFPRSLEKLLNHLAVKMTIACPWIYGWSTARSGWCGGVGWWGGGWWQTLGNRVGP